MRGPRRAPSRLLLSALTLAALIAGAARLTAGGSPPERVRIKVFYGRYLAFAPLAIASVEGFFQSQGLDVEMVHLGGSQEATPALIRGEIDVSAGMMRVAEFNAIARGALLRIVADKGHYEAGPCVTAAFVAQPGFLAVKSPDSPEHLRGARVFASPLSFGEYVLETFVNSKGLRLADLNVSKLQDTGAIEAYTEGSLDFYRLGEPYLSRVVRSGRAVLWKPVQEIVPGAQSATLVYGPSLLTKNREAGRRFMVAYLQGVRQYNLGKTARNVDIVSKETGLDPTLVREACWESIRADGKINVESVLDFQRWAVRRGVLDAPLPPAKFWDPSFVEEANSVLEAASGDAPNKR
jgi:ABC-type nitrate/sulfonate/bicarbonate transport system substrate-binding protein